MNNNFDLSKFLIENKLTTATRVASKEKALRSSGMSLDETEVEDVDLDTVVPQEENAPFNEEQVEEDFSKYATVEELMKEIENSTNEAAHKHKMERVKAAYESLEAKATSLEEGEHSAYISTSKIKEMKMSSKKLRKMYESLSKVYEKKYAKKEK